MWPRCRRSDGDKRLASRILSNFGHDQTTNVLIETQIKDIQVTEMFTSLQILLTYLVSFKQKGVDFWKALNNSPSQLLRSNVLGLGAKCHRQEIASGSMLWPVAQYATIRYTTTREYRFAK